MIEKSLHRYAVFYVSSTKVTHGHQQIWYPVFQQTGGGTALLQQFLQYHRLHAGFKEYGGANQPEQLSCYDFRRGRHGKGTDCTAIYAQSSLQHNPLIAINCSLVNDKSWGFLTNHYNSPLNDNNNTIYFKNIEVLPSERRKQLLSIILDMNLEKRNRLIFSCVSASQTALPAAARDLSTCSPA